MSSARDYFNQPLNPGDRVLVAYDYEPRYFRIATVIRFTEKSLVISRAGVTPGKKPLYVKPGQVIKMTEELERLECFRILSR